MSRHRCTPSVTQTPLPAEMDLGLRGFLRYLQAERSASPYTVRNYGREVEEFLRFLASEGIQRWPEVGQEVLRRYLLWLASRGYARGSIARRVAEVHSFGAYLQREGWAADNPFVALEARAPKNKRRLPEVLGVAEAQVLVAPKADGARSPLRSAQDLRDRAILEVLYAGGLRVSELVGLDLDDYDLHRGELRVLGKGNKERIALLGVPARTALQAYLQNGRPALADGHRRSAALFLNRFGGRLTARSVQSLLHQYTLQAGLSKRVTPHVLRHTFATHLLDGGADLRVVQELLGHAQLATTQIYTHVSRSQVRSVYLRSHPLAKEGQAESSSPATTSGEEKP